MVEARFEYRKGLRIFDQKMKRFVKALMVGSEMGMKTAAEEYLNDSLNVVPKVPYRTGWLKEHHEAFVQKIGKSYIGGVRVVDTPYAPVLHEGISRWGTPFHFKAPGSGPKWIESKQRRFHKKYLKIATYVATSYAKRAMK